MTRTVVHVLEAFIGGTERHLLDLVEHVEDVHHVIAVPSTHRGQSTAPAAAKARELGAEVEYLEMARGTTAHRNAGAVTALRAVLRKFRPDVVHGHSSIGGAVARLAASRVPVPVAYTPNALSRSPLALAVERSLRWRTDRFIAVSHGEAEFALQNRVISPSRLTVIPNGIDLRSPELPRRSLRKRLGIPAEAPVVGCLGRLSWQKAPEVYVKACGIAANRLPDAHFVLVGDGPQRDRVQSALARTGLGERFHWVQSLPGAAATFGEFDVYVLPSRYEGGAYSPLEAMRAGTPVILTDAAGNSDTVEHGVTGLLVPVDDATSLGHSIIDLMRDGQRRAAFATAARRRLGLKFDVRIMGQETGRVYDELVMSRRRITDEPRRAGLVKQAVG
jgi:glycosyltransferase involved in cell wall biosynthesis